MSFEYTKYYVRIYTKKENNEQWQTLGPYDESFAVQLMYNYLKKGICCWVIDVKISE
jgi:hypothetical protein